MTGISQSSKAILAHPFYPCCGAHLSRSPCPCGKNRYPGTGFDGCNPYYAAIVEKRAQEQNKPQREGEAT